MGSSICLKWLRNRLLQIIGHRSHEMARILQNDVIVSVFLRSMRGPDPSGPMAFVYPVHPDPGRAPLRVRRSAVSCVGIRKLRNHTFVRRVPGTTPVIVRRRLGTSSLAEALARSLSTRTTTTGRHARLPKASATQDPGTPLPPSPEPLRARLLAPSCWS